MKKIVLKFGGTSVADAQAMQRSAQIALSRQAKIVLVSATSGTTNQLVTLSRVSKDSDPDERENILAQIRVRHLGIAKDIGAPPEVVAQIQDCCKNLETLIRGTYLLQDCSPKFCDRILAIGELMSSALFAHVMNSQAPYDVKYFDVRKVLKTSERHMKGEPLLEETSKLAKEFFALNDSNIAYVGQGFIASTMDGMTTTLGRGGSDYSAALIAEAIEAEHLEIWTDVEGIKSTDPRICPKAKTIHEISFKEASELANFGAKVLHPTCLWPSLRKGFPVYVGSTMNPDSQGTWITKSNENSPLVRAISFKQQQAVMSISTPVMSQASGFLAKIFDVFKKYEISVDVVTTSEISVAVTVDQEALDDCDFLDELESLGHVNVERGLSLISVVGNNINYTPGLLLQIMGSIEEINVRAISGGASKHNINFLVPEESSVEVVQRIHGRFLES